jgi:hypothetical protein
MRVLLLFFLFILSSQAFACECEFFSEEDKYIQADAVFTGQTIKEPEFAHSALWSYFKILDTSKVNDEAKPFFTDEKLQADKGLLLIQSYNNCAYLFEEGSTYIVYAVVESTEDGDEYLSTNICTGTKELE